MKKISWLWMVSILTILSLIGCSGGNSAQQTKDTTQAKSTEIMVSAAASLRDSLTELQKNYTKTNPNIKLTLNFEASGTLQQQIEKGAPADLFISAGKSQMDNLEAKNLIVKDTRINLLGNDLVLITEKGNNTITSLDDLKKASVAKIGIGTPESVPAGKYAQESLTNLKLWDPLQSKFVFAKNVTQVLNYVETGNTEAGFVYKSDAQASKKVKIVTVVPESSHKQIIYPAAVIASTKNKQVTEDFLKYLESSEAQQVFEKYGFKSAAK